MWRWMLGAVLVTAASVSAQQPFGQWDFNSGDLSATVGDDLAFRNDFFDDSTKNGTQFGTTESLGIPTIDGVSAHVMKFPSLDTSLGQGYSMQNPATGTDGGSTVSTYTFILDVLYPETASGTIRPLLETDVLTPADLLVDENNGLSGGDGEGAGTLAPNTWYRIGFVVDGQSGKLRKYIDGTEVGSEDLGTAGRYELQVGFPSTLFANTFVWPDVADPNASGYVSSIQLRTEALSAPQMIAMGGPSAAGIPQDVPPIPSFIEHWVPLASVANLDTDIGAVINKGGTTIDTGTIVLELDGTAQTGLQIVDNGTTISVMKTGLGDFLAGSRHTLDLRFEDSLDGAKSFSHKFKAAYLWEDFEELTLGTSPEEDPTAEEVWTDVPPTGWTVDRSGMPGYGDPQTDGVTDWSGWTFADKEWWTAAAGDQRRSEYTRGSGAVAVADPDEWDDADHPKVNGEYFNSFMSTPVIDVSGALENTLFIKFDSSWRPEAFDDDWGAGNLNNQTATITMSVDGGDPAEIFRWESDSASPFFHDDNPNESVEILLNNSAGISTVQFTFGLTQAGNDWWWAIDNLEINGGDIASEVVDFTPARDATGVGPQPIISAVIDPGTVTVDPASAQLQLDGVNVGTTTEVNSDGNLVVSGQAPTVLDKLSTHTATLIYSDDLDGSKTTDWSFTVANYREIVVSTPAVWVEEFNGVAEGTFPEGWVATNDTTVVDEGYDLGNWGSAAYEDFVVISAQRVASLFGGRRLNVAPQTFNGQGVTSLMSGNVVYGESDHRGGDQIQVLVSPAIDLTGITDVQLVFNSIYEQNQDSMGAVEYSVDGGATWLPLLYMIDQDDVFAGDPFTTMTTARGDQAQGLAYSAFIGADVSSITEDHISGRVNDDQVESKRIEVLDMPEAANKSDVRLRFTQTGTASWYFGIDDVAIHGNGGAPVAPTFVSQPRSQAVEANTPAQLLANVPPEATRPLSIQWTLDGENVEGANELSYMIPAMEESDAGDYRLIVSNTGGSVTSQVATLTFIAPVPPTITDGPADLGIAEDLIGSLTVTATGTEPFSYQWYFEGAPIEGATDATLDIPHITSDNAGGYSVVVSNTYGSATSAVAQVTVLPPPAVEVTGQWDFNDGTLAATVGNDLVPFDETVGADTQFGTTTSFGIADIGGSPAAVLYFAPSVSAWGGYEMHHGAQPNGGGSFVNRYTVIYDVYYPAGSDSRWRSFLQTNTGNGNDGDIFVNTANGIGISGNYTGTVAADSWHRIAFVFDLTYATLKKYIDGAPVGEQTLGSGLDGRWSLDPVALLFADENGDQAPTYANSVQFRNGLMTDDEIAALGGATEASGIPGPPPRIGALVVNGENVEITWQGRPDVKLQKTTSLTTPDWQDVPGTLGASSATDSFSPDGAFYRLALQP